MLDLIRRLQSCVLAGLLTAAISPTAWAGTVTFDLEPRLDTPLPAIYDSNGLTFTTTGLQYVAPDTPRVGPRNGTPSLFFSEGDLVITRTGGGFFLLNSLDFAFSRELGVSAPLDYTIEGPDGSTHTAFYRASSYEFSHFNLDREVRSFTVHRLGAPGVPVMVDNVRFNEHTLVPEPGVWTLMLCGFGAIGGLLRRRAPRSILES